MKSESWFRAFQIVIALGVLLATGLGIHTCSEEIKKESVRTSKLPIHTEYYQIRFFDGDIDTVSFQRRRGWNFDNGTMTLSDGELRYNYKTIASGVKIYKYLGDDIHGLE